MPLGNHEELDGLTCLDRAWWAVLISCLELQKGATQHMYACNLRDRVARLTTVLGLLHVADFSASYRISHCRVRGAVLQHL